VDSVPPHPKKLKKKQYLACFYYCGSTDLCRTFTAFSVSWSYPQSVGLLWRGISPSPGRYLHTKQHKHRIYAQSTDILALSGIRTHYPSVRVGEDSSSVRSLWSAFRCTSPSAFEEAGWGVWQSHEQWPWYLCFVVSKQFDCLVNEQMATHTKISNLIFKAMGKKLF
jgi:hypothetical protein